MEVSPPNKLMQNNTDPYSAISSDLCRSCASSQKCRPAEHEGCTSTDYYPGEPKTHVDLGASALKEGSLHDAESAFEKARTLNLDCFRASYGLALICQQKGDFSRAFQTYLKCLDLDGTSLPALLGLFQTSLRTGSLTAIRQYLEINLEVTPGDTAIMFCLTALYLKQNRLDDAKKVLTDILIMDPAYREAARKRWNVRWLSETAVRNQVTGR